MANKKVSDLTATTAVASGDLFMMENAGGNSRKITGTNLAKGLPALGLRGALVGLSADVTGVNLTGGSGVDLTQWDTEVYDTDSLWTSGAASRFTIPAGVSKVLVSAQIGVTSVVATGVLNVWHYNSSNVQQNTIGLGQAGMASNSFSEITLNAVGAPAGISVAAGDYFIAHYYQSADTSVTMECERCWFGIQILA